MSDGAATVLEMSAVDSSAVFCARAIAVRLDQTVIDSLKAEGLDSFARFSFCCNYSPGKDDDSALLRTLKRLNGNVDPSEACTASFRRLFFESFSLSASELREKLDRTEDSAPRKIPTPERHHRLSALQQRLGAGILLESEREPADALVDLCHAQYEENRLQWVSWDRCGKRDSEVSGGKKISVFKPDSAGNIKLLKEQEEQHADVGSDLLMRLALQRRSVAYDLANLVQYEIMEAWHDLLIEHKLRDPPPGYTRVTIEQLHIADKYLFEVLARATRAGITPSLLGVKPLDSLFPAKMMGADVQLYLMPRMISSVPKVPKVTPTLPADPVKLSQNQKRKLRLREKAAADAAGRPKGKGKGKGKQATAGHSSMPAALQGGVSKNDRGKALCYGYNLGTCTVTGAFCPKGLHQCCKPGCFDESHIYIECPN